MKPIKFDLADGHYTEVVFWKEGGTVHAFPDENVDLVKAEGTEQTKELLRRLLSGEAKGAADSSQKERKEREALPEKTKRRKQKFKPACCCGEPDREYVDEWGNTIVGGRTPKKYRLR